VAVSALLGLARWCQRRKELVQGGNQCQKSERIVYPPSIGQRVPLRHLWTEAPPGNRQAILKALGRMVVQQVRPRRKKGVPHEDD